MNAPFGSVAPCRSCEGHGRAVSAMTAAEKRERARDLRTAKREGYTLPRMGTVKVCRECGGKGVVPVSEADARRDERKPRERFEGERPMGMWE